MQQRNEKELTYLWHWGLSLRFHVHHLFFWRLKIEPEKRCNMKIQKNKKYCGWRNCIHIHIFAVLIIMHMYYKIFICHWEQNKQSIDLSFMLYRLTYANQPWNLEVCVSYISLCVLILDHTNHNQSPRRSNKPWIMIMSNFIIFIFTHTCSIFHASAFFIPYI